MTVWDESAGAMSCSSGSAALFSNSVLSSHCCFSVISASAVSDLSWFGSSSKWSSCFPVSSCGLSGFLVGNCCSPINLLRVPESRSPAKYSRTLYIQHSMWMSQHKYINTYIGPEYIYAQAQNTIMYGYQGGCPNIRAYTHYI